MAPVRTFIAIKLDGSLHNTLNEVIEKFAASKARVKWVASQNVHITLKVLGNIEEERLPDIFSACEKAAEGFSPIDLEVRAVGCFPTLARPRVVWLGLEKGKEAVKELQHSVERELELIGFPEEEREFRAHLTIGRVKGKEGITRLCRLIEEERNIFIGSMRVATISVMKSKTLPSGPFYTELKSISLL